MGEYKELKQKNYSKELGKYRIEYEHGVVQEKYLILQEEFYQLKRPLENVIDYLKSTDRKDKSKELRNFLDSFNVSELFFVTTSPLYDAISTGILKSYDGDVKIKITKL